MTLPRTVSRRGFLQGVGGLAAAGALGFPAVGRAEAIWGDPGSRGVMPTGRRPDGVLELFMLGGASPWESFYVAPANGQPSGSRAGQQWWSFQDAIAEAFDGCGGGDRPLTQFFANDGLGSDIFLGPFVYPLRDRPDITGRMRVVVTSHDALPHQTAVPLAMTGHRATSARMAGTAAHVQRHFGEKQPGVDVPFAYVLFPTSDTVAIQNAEAAAAVGMQEVAAAHPLTLRLGKSNPIRAMLARSQMAGSAEASDALAKLYLTQIRDRLGAEPRPGVLSRLASANDSLRRSQSLLAVLTESALTLHPGDRCGVQSEVDHTGTGFHTAAHLLTSPVMPARWVTLVDTGLLEAPAGGYDSHSNHVPVMSTNIVNACRHLSDIVNRPGEADPSKLDLDRHLIVVSTEMGRTPYRQVDEPTGSDHWPYGYVTVLIGGPITGAEAGLVGAIDAAGYAVDSASPAQIRCALLAAQGIWPFEPEAFSSDDIGASSLEEGLTLAMARVLGTRALR